MVLSNQEKLQLLHTGCLGGSVPSVAASMLDWEDSNEQDESSSSDYSSDSDSDVEESNQEEDEWGGQQQGGVADSHMLLGEDGGAEARHFDKQQVGLLEWCWQHQSLGQQPLFWSFCAAVLDSTHVCCARPMFMLLYSGEAA
jgi:hypothetical protein